MTEVTFLRRQRRAIGLLLVLLIAASSSASAQTHSFVWKATKGSGVVYLVGSVHVLSKDYYPLAPALDTAYKDSTLLVEEVDMGEMTSPDAQMQLLSHGMLPAGQRLDQVVTPETRLLVNKAVEDTGVPSVALQLMKPWMAALTLDALEWQKAGFDPDLGLDKHFYDIAMKDRKPVQGLETLSYQMSIFDDMTLEQQDHLLSETLKELHTEQAMLNEAARAWKQGDAATLERITLEDLKSDPLMYQRLLLDRNRAWLPKIEALFTRPRPTLVIVGAAHVVGPDGLLQMLKAAGYSIEQQ
jgi:uncharacterized protein YbaP (TraB family)